MTSQRQQGDSPKLTHNALSPYSVKLTAAIVYSTVVEHVVRVEAANADEALRSVWPDRLHHISPLVPEGSEIVDLRAEVN